LVIQLISPPATSSRMEFGRPYGIGASTPSQSPLPSVAILGGPTFDLDGNVIGVNTAIYSLSGGKVGIAFDIPAYTVKSVVAQLTDQRLPTVGQHVATSAGEETALPFTSMMTSPVWKRSPAVLSGSSCVTATASPTGAWAKPDVHLVCGSSGSPKLVNLSFHAGVHELFPG
jgi:hypothetical protein